MSEQRVEHGANQAVTGDADPGEGQGLAHAVTRGDQEPSDARTGDPLAGDQAGRARAGAAGESAEAGETEGQRLLERTEAAAAEASDPALDPDARR